MNSCLIILVIFIRSFRVILFFLIRNERLNLFLGTIMSGLFVLCCCCGRTRYDEECDGDTKFCSFVMNCVIGLSQFATIILCLVGWCWSIGWGITLISVSSKFLKAQQDQIWDENMTSSYLQKTGLLLANLADQPIRGQFFGRKELDIIFSSQM